MHTRPLDFDDLPKALSLCERLLVVRRHWIELSETQSQLEKSPESLLKLEIPVVDDSSIVAHNLPLPDFDETGFIGRKPVVEQLKKACTGVYPVITVVGEGGLGKTALVTKVAYDLLDAKVPPFEAIVFVTAKTAQLSVVEIRRIEGAITTSMGLIERAIEVLGGQKGDPLQELVSLLTEFRVLLIIDNLETVVDDHLRALLEGLPSGSRILLTSRIGLGAFEYPIVLKPLIDAESVQLLRAVAMTRGCQKLVEMPNAKLATFCNRMRNNPLHIKWFVSAVQAGRRPEEVLANDKLFLQFCLSNVYQQISDGGRRLVRYLLAVGGAFTVAELAFLTEMEDLNLLKAVQELMRTNMLIMTSAALGRSFETRYELSALARSYVGTFYPVAKDEQKRLLQRKHALVAAGAELAQGFDKNLVSAFSIFLRSRSDWVVGKYLKDALMAVRRSEWSNAAQLITRAKGLAPDYFEVYRVAAYADSQMGNFTDALENYRRAVELEPTSLNTRMLFGGFLLRDVEDVDAAAEQFNEAAKIAPENIDVQAEFGRVYLFQGRFDEAEKILMAISPPSGTNERSLRKIEDLRLQIFTRAATHHLQKQEPLKALNALEDLRMYFEKIQSPDKRMRVKIARQISVLRGIRGSAPPSEYERIDELYTWAQTVGDDSAGDETWPQSEQLSIVPRSGSGVIARIATNGKFGFIRQGNGHELFFHHSQIDAAVSYRVGAKVCFEVEVDNMHRPRAVGIRPE